MAEVVASSTQPALGAIRLAWWREALERLDKAPPPPEPRLQAAAAELLTRGIAGATIARIEDGWAALLDENLDFERIGQRGVQLFEAGARLLGASDDRFEAAGRLFSCQDATRRGLAPFHDPADAIRLLAGHRFPRRLRPLTGLARLAARDVKQAPEIEPEATPGRAAALLSHRLFGTVA